mmetsp:Transcript_14809/g.37487  ORF Transcript_14809/g.37487 Transcript_14809/m.37487 type:complete len:238 (+) Transcript_14809:594-1307(+)
MCVGLFGSAFPGPPGAAVCSMSRPLDAARGVPVLWATQQLGSSVFAVCCRGETGKRGAVEQTKAVHCQGFLVASSWIKAPSPGTTTEANRPACPGVRGRGVDRGGGRDGPELGARRPARRLLTVEPEKATQSLWLDAGPAPTLCRPWACGGVDGVPGDARIYVCAWRLAGGQAAVPGVGSYILLVVLGMVAAARPLHGGWARTQRERLCRRVNGGLVNLLHLIIPECNNSRAPGARF